MGTINCLKECEPELYFCKGMDWVWTTEGCLRVQIFPSSYSVLLEAELNRRHPKCELSASPYVIFHKYHIVVETQGFRYLRDHLGNFSPFNS